MTTANELILSACQKLGVKESGGTLTALEQADCLNVLNSMLDAWSIEKLLIYHTAQALYLWVAGNISYTIGAGGAFNGQRPLSIEPGTFFRSGTGAVDTPVEILRSRQTYDAYSVKGSVGGIPDALFLDATYPLATLYCYPVPDTSITLFLNYKILLQNFAAVTDVAVLPPGYRWAIEHNLAVALESVFQAPAPASVKSAAADAKRTIKRSNHAPTTSSLDLALRGGYNVYTGE